MDRTTRGITSSPFSDSIPYAKRKTAKINTFKLNHVYKYRVEINKIGTYARC